MTDIDSSWEVEKYKTPNEMEHEWQLRKKFLIAHKGKYSEERLVYLAQLFCNVYFLGCKYADPVMELIDSLSQGITEKNEKWEGPGFVSASSAAEERVKSRMNIGEQKSSSRNPINFVQSTNLNTSQEIDINIDEKNADMWLRGQKRPCGSGLGFASGESELGSQPFKKGRIDVIPEGKQQTHYSCERKRIQYDVGRVIESGPFGKVVVFQSALATEESPISVIERTASAAHMSTAFDYLPQADGVTCKLSLDGLYLATGTGRSQKIAKETACKVAIERLKETSFTIMVKASFIGSESVDRDLNSEENRSKESSNMDTPIADSNIGSKMLKLMGWTGGGLGRTEQGMEEPIKPYESNVRLGGLGISNFKDFRQKIMRIIEDFAHRETKEDLVFSPEFNKEERKVIHELVRKYNLKSRSFGKEESIRRLVVFKKIRPLEIVEDLISCGGETDKYKLVAPLSVNLA